MNSRPINLNRARKARDRVAKRAQATENAVKHGRSKAEKTADTLTRTRAEKHLDDHKREPE